MPQDRTTVRLLDGAMGTELERRGVSVELPLWSTHALIERPDVVERIHCDYLEAGATVITANTFRTHQRTLEKAGVSENAAALTERAVGLARSAVADVREGALVAGSVGPLEDCYFPERSPAFEVCLDEQRRHIENLLRAGVDVVLIETVGTRREAIAAAQAARELAAGRWAISFLLHNVPTPGVLLNGSPLADVLSEMEGAQAIGVNCVAAPAMLEQIRLLRRFVPEATPLIASANTGTVDETGAWLPTPGVDPERYADLAETWLEAGARLIGGCCGTTPATIAALHRRLVAG